MDFVLALHSHLPYVLNHGRWPHGSDWLCEAAIDTYLPLLDTLRRLAADGVPSPLTIGFTPVLANQLVAPAFAEELEAYFEQRLKACDEAAGTFAGTVDEHLIPVAGYWYDRLQSLRALFRSVNGDLVAAFRALEEAGHIEIIGGAATHGFLPLLGRDESVRLQLLLGRAEHERLFGRAPAGCWLPECAYRARGPWAPLPGAPASDERPGTEEFVAEAGFQYFFTDAHLAAAGTPLSAYDEIPMGAERFDLHGRSRRGAPQVATIEHSPYKAYRLRSRRGGSAAVAALVRDPVASLQVWSRHGGYPGDGTYLEFHKIRWPGGLKLWRVTGNDVDLGDKQAYDPAAARGRAADHATHFVQLLRRIALTDSQEVSEDGEAGDVVVSPFDTELFGHWWFEGPDFLGEVYRRFADTSDVQPTTASSHLRDRPPATTRPPGRGNGCGRWSMRFGKPRPQRCGRRPRGPSWPRRRASCSSRKARTGSSSFRPGKSPTTRLDASTSTATTSSGCSRDWRRGGEAIWNRRAHSPRSSAGATTCFQTFCRTSRPRWFHLDRGERGRGRRDAHVGHVRRSRPATSVVPADI